MHPRPNIPTVRTITLPSGHTVELINFGDPSAPKTVDRTPAQRPLHICRNCGSQLVQPISWLQEGDQHWEMTLRCPDCNHVETGHFSESQVESFEDVIDVALAQMVDGLQRLTRANMVDDVERLIAAINRGLILPEDF